MEIFDLTLLQNYIVSVLVPLSMLIKEEYTTPDLDAYIPQILLQIPQTSVDSFDNGLDGILEQPASQCIDTFDQSNISDSSQLNFNININSYLNPAKWETYVKQFEYLIKPCTVVLTRCQINNKVGKSSPYPKTCGALPTESKPYESISTKNASSVATIKKISGKSIYNTL